MNAANLNKLAEYCATNGDYNSAIEYYLKLTTIDPDNGPAWTALGHCYLLIEDL
jgi:Flp pilus assembly protein TadD